MAIKTLQQQIRELGRIRTGKFDTPAGGKGRPVKLNRFRLTSADPELLGHVAQLYGGTVKPWQPQGGGPAGFEVIIDEVRLPVFVPRQPVSQFLELWQGGGCVRRCDGEEELLTHKPCKCDPDPGRRLCSYTTRLSVVLRHVPGLGLWRLETHGWNAARELPQLAELLAGAGDAVPAFLGLVERVTKKAAIPGLRDKSETYRYVVPTLDVDGITPAQLAAARRPEIAAPARPALPRGGTE